MKKRLFMLAAAVAVIVAATACTFPSAQLPSEPAGPAPVPSVEPPPPGPSELDLPTPDGPPSTSSAPDAMPSSPVTPSSSPEASEPSDSEPSDSEPSDSEPSDSETPSTAEDAVATRRGSLHRVRVRGSLFPVERSGQTATVNLLIVSEDPTKTFSLISSFADGNPEVSSRHSASVDGIRLIDPVGKKVYLAATTADGTCVCTPTDGSGVYESETVLWVTVAFAAPPASSTTVDVVLPVFGTVNDVPIR